MRFCVEKLIGWNPSWNGPTVAFAMIVHVPFV